MNQVGLQFGYFLLDYFVFLQFALKESFGYLRLFLNTAGGQLIEIGYLAFGITEIPDLDQTHLDQGLNAVVGLAQGYPHEPGQVALAEFRLLLDDFKDAVAGVDIHWLQV